MGFLWFIAVLASSSLVAGYPSHQALVPSLVDVTVPEPENFKCFPDFPSGRLCGMARPGYGSGRTDAKDFKYVLKQIRDETKKLIVVAIDDQQWTKLHKSFNEQVGRINAVYVDKLNKKSTIVEDFSSPTIDQLDNYATQVEIQLTDGNTVVTHCAGGMGRTGVHLIAYFLRRFFVELTSKGLAAPWSETGEKAISYVTENYNEDAGEFDYVPKNLAALKDYYKKLATVTGHCSDAATEEACAAKNYCTFCSGNMLGGKFKKCRWNPVWCRGTKVPAKFAPY